MSDFHTFTLIFTIPGVDDLEPYVDTLYEAGLDDAALMGPATDGTFSAEFDREADEFSTAVTSAIVDLSSAVDGLRVLRVAPDDLATIAVIAARTGRSLESVRLLSNGKRGPKNFPPALGYINEKTQVWRWADVAAWFDRELDERPPDSEHARFIAALNHTLELAASIDDLREHPDELAAVARFMPEGLAAA